MTARLVSGRVRFEVVGGDALIITEPFVVNVLDRDWPIHPGDRTDLASFPWFGYLLYHPFEGAAASVWHDLRYVERDVTREEADRGWYELAIAGHSKETRMPKWKARVGWAALRMFGWRPWGSYRTKS